MKRLLLLLSAAALLASCSAELPRVAPAGPPTAERIRQSCLTPFPKGKWQFVHAIEAVMSGGKKVFVMGVVVMSSEERSFQCVIMTLEGLVVFDAAYRGQLTVDRAIAPFDSKAFAEGLAKDIQLIFFRPSGPLVDSGFLEKGASVCRYRYPGGGFVDVISNRDRCWEIRQYGLDDRLLRTVKMHPGQGAAGMPKRIELRAQGPRGYKLIMNLIEAVPIQE